MSCKLVEKLLYSNAMKLGQVRIKGQAVLAPMAGISESSFRLLCRQQGAAIVFSEMVSSDGLIRENQRTVDYLKFYPDERPFGVQLFGADPTVVAQSVKIINQFFPDFIDLNFGCPVKKVIRKGAGAAVLKNIQLLRNITSAVVAATSIPVMAKIRSGWDKSSENAVEFARILEDCGVCAITLHPRTQAQMFRGHSNWDLIGEVKQAVSVPVIGNGDIKNPVDAKKMLDHTSCDLVMIGRAAFGNPWIFKQVNQYLDTGSINSQISIESRLNMCLQHLELSVSDKGELRGVREMRKHLAWYVKNLPFSSAFRAALMKLDEADQVKQTLIDYFLNLKQSLDSDHDRTVS